MTKEPKENIALVCSDCGDEQYFKIKERFVAILIYY